MNTLSDTELDDMVDDINETIRREELLELDLMNPDRFKTVFQSIGLTFNEIME